MLVTGGADINKAMNDVCTPLFIASLNGHDKVVSMLLTGGADVNQKAWQGRTALWAAQDRNHDAIIALLKSKGANPGGGAAEELCPSDRCKVFWARGYKRWYPGTVESLLDDSPNGTPPRGPQYIVAFDDGDRSRYSRADGEVKPLKIMLPPDGARYTEMQQLEVNIIGQGWTPCMVTKINFASKHRQKKNVGSYDVLNQVTGTVMEDIIEGRLRVPGTPDIVQVPRRGGFMSYLGFG